MDFIEYANNWVKSEVLQSRIMIAIGIVFLIGFIGILKSQNEFLKGSIIPMIVTILLLIGYGGYIAYSRPAHTEKSIALYQKSEHEAIVKEKEKHINDNKAGKTLLKIYPILTLISMILLLIVSKPYYKGMAISFALLFLITYVMDFGFVSRSDTYLEFLSKLPSN